MSDKMILFKEQLLLLLQDRERWAQFRENPVETAKKWGVTLSKDQAAVFIEVFRAFIDKLGEAQHEWINAIASGSILIRGPAIDNAGSGRVGNGPKMWDELHGHWEFPLVVGEYLMQAMRHTTQQVMPAQGT